MTPEELDAIEAAAKALRAANARLDGDEPDFHDVAAVDKAKAALAKLMDDDAVLSLVRLARLAAELENDVLILNTELARRMAANVVAGRQP